MASRVGYPDHLPTFHLLFTLLNINKSIRSLDSLHSTMSIMSQELVQICVDMSSLQVEGLL